MFVAAASLLSGACDTSKLTQGVANPVAGKWFCYLVDDEESGEHISNDFFYFTEEFEFAHVIHGEDDGPQWIITRGPIPYICDIEWNGRDGSSGGIQLETRCGPNAFGYLLDRTADPDELVFLNVCKHDHTADYYLTRSDEPPDLADLVD